MIISQLKKTFRLILNYISLKVISKRNSFEKLK